MPRRIFPAGSVSNTTGAPLRLAFHASSTTGRREVDMWTVDGSNNLLDRIPNGIVVTDVAGAYSAFAGPDDVDALWIQPHTGAARTQIAATGYVATSTVDAGLTGTYVPKVGRAPLRRRNVPGIAGLPTAMASPPTVTDSTTSTLAGTIVWSDRGDAFTYSRRMAKKPSFPDSQYHWPIAAAGTNNTDGAFITPCFRVSFLTDAPTFEILSKGNGGAFRVLINGQYVTAGGLSTQTLASDSAIHYTAVANGSRAWRRVDVDYISNSAFGGVRAGATDTVTALPANNQPRLLVLGDSFAEGTGTTVAYMSFVYTLASLLGCVPVPSGWGATGYLNDNGGAKKTLRQRFATDVVPESPDVIIYAGGINDWNNYTASAIGTEAGLLFAQGKAAFPDSQHFVLSPFWRNGVETIAATLLATRDALKAQGAAVGFPFIDLLEMPLLAGQSLATTLSASIAANATTTTTAARLASSSGGNGAGFTVEVGTGTANVERRLVTSWTGGGPFTLTPQGAFSNTHSSGDQVNLVGSCFWTGTGRAGSTTGVGNSDLLVLADGTHPTQAGHDAIAYAIFNQILPLLSA